MKLFRNLLDSIKPNFEKGGKLENLYPAYEAFDTLLFVPNHTAKNGTHIKDGVDLKRTMVTVILALLPCLLFGIWNTGHQHFIALGEFLGAGEGFMDKVIYGAIQVLPIVVVSYAVGLGVEFAFAVKNGHSVEEGFLVSGMLIPLILPVGVPLWMVAVATIFAVVFGKEVFGGTGMNVLNPALTARAFLFFAYPTKMSGDKVWIDTTLEEGEKLVDGFSGATPLGDGVAGAMDNFPSMMESFIGIIPGSIGETSSLACLLGAALLLFSGVASWRVMLSMFIGGYAMGLIFNLAGVESTNALLSIDPLHQLMLGGFMFGLVYMATDPVSAAQTNTGKWIYGFLIGFMAILIRVANPAYPEGVMLAILLGNVCAPLIDHVVVSSNIKKRLNRVKTA
jgi:Na+-transporting NADH:ubiquinone oxidoreductase subunit B